MRQYTYQQEGKQRQTQETVSGWLNTLNEMRNNDYFTYSQTAFVLVENISLHFAFELRKG